MKHASSIPLNQLSSAIGNSFVFFKYIMDRLNNEFALNQDNKLPNPMTTCSLLSILYQILVDLLMAYFFKETQALQNFDYFAELAAYEEFEQEDE